MDISFLRVPVVWGGESPEWRCLYLLWYVRVSIQGSYSAEVPQMCPQSLVSLMLKTFPANPGETKHNWIYRWALRQPKPGKDNVPSLGEGAGRSWKPALQSQGLETNSALLLSWKPPRTLQLLFQTWSDGQEKLNFRELLCMFPDLDGLQNSLYDWGEIIVLFSSSIAEYINHVENPPALPTNWSRSWLAAGAAPAVVAGKLVVKESLGKDWHCWWAEGRAMPWCHCRRWTDELRLKGVTPTAGGGAAASTSGLLSPSQALECSFMGLLGKSLQQVWDFKRPDVRILF